MKTYDTPFSLIVALKSHNASLQKNKTIRLRLMMQVETESKHKFYLHEATVKAAKELIIDRQVS